MYQEQILTSADENQTYVVRFDAKKGNIGGNTTANWFMKTFIPAPFFQSSIQTLDMTSLPATWGTYCVVLTIPGGTAGQTFQFGYSSTASNFEPSGNFVDNIDFGTPAALGVVDTDNDGVFNCADPDDDNDGILDNTTANRLLPTTGATFPMMALTPRLREPRSLARKPVLQGTPLP